MRFPFQTHRDAKGSPGEVVRAFIPNVRLETNNAGWYLWIADSVFLSDSRRYRPALSALASEHWNECPPYFAGAAFGILQVKWKSPLQGLGVFLAKSFFQHNITLKKLRKCASIILPVLWRLPSVFSCLSTCVLLYYIPNKKLVNTCTIRPKSSEKNALFNLCKFRFLLSFH